MTYNACIECLLMSGLIAQVPSLWVSGSINWIPTETTSSWLLALECRVCMGRHCHLSTAAEEIQSLSVSHPGWDISQKLKNFFQNMNWTNWKPQKKKKWTELRQQETTHLWSNTVDNIWYFHNSGVPEPRPWKQIETNTYYTTNNPKNNVNYTW